MIDYDGDRCVVVGADFRFDIPVAVKDYIAFSAPLNRNQLLPYSATESVGSQRHKITFAMLVYYVSILV